MGVDFDLNGLHDEHTMRAGVPPPLSELCVRVLASNFASRPTLRGIAPRYINRMTELLPTDLPLEVTGPLIDDEGYWKRCAEKRWDNCKISDHGSSWKRMYFERNLAEFLEVFDPVKQDTEELTRTLAVSKDYIFSLRIKQFLSHLDMEMLFQNVPTLCNLEMTFGVREIGMEYERSLFGMKMSDVTSLQKALRVTETLTILSLPCNLLDDNTMRILATGLQVRPRLGREERPSTSAQLSRALSRVLSSIAPLMCHVPLSLTLAPLPSPSCAGQFDDHCIGPLAQQDR
jgi:hypothetical protein